MFYISEQKMCRIAFQHHCRSPRNTSQRQREGELGRKKGEEKTDREEEARRWRTREADRGGREGKRYIDGGHSKSERVKETREGEKEEERGKEVATTWCHLRSIIISWCREGTP